MNNYYYQQTKMFRSILGKNLIQSVSALNSSQQVVRTSFVRFNSNNANLDQLKSIFGDSKSTTKQASESTNKQSLNIDDLLNSSIPEAKSPSTTFPTTFSLHDKFGFEQNRQPTPREVAKNIREFGTNAGRTVDVNYNNISRSFNQMRRVVNENKIRYLQRIQSRYIRPAKYRKQLKREWWRRKFAAGFKDLLHQVNDARRRGY